MPEIVRAPKIAFTAVSTVLLLGLSGCAGPYEEVGLCTYLSGCGSNKTSTDPGMPHYYGDINLSGDDEDGDDGMGGDEEER